MEPKGGGGIIPGGIIPGGGNIPGGGIIPMGNDIGIPLVDFSACLTVVRLC